MEEAIDDAFDESSLIGTSAPPGSSAKFFVGEEFNGPSTTILTGAAAESFKGLLLKQAWGKVDTAGDSQEEQQTAVNKNVGSNEFVIYLRTVRGQTMSIPIQTHFTVATLKNTICRKMNIPFYTQALKYEDKQLDDRRLLCDYQIMYGATLFLVPIENGMNIPGLGECLLDPGFHYDFTQEKKDDKQYTRGGRPYSRPIGWFRYSLKVRGKYENDTWLVGTKRRSAPHESAPGEWPVSYHGTSFHNGTGIAEQGYLLSKGVRFAYGRGIYSTPNIDVASQYAQRMVHEGVTYIVIIQNRVNPEKVKEVATDYWLVPDDKDIRPYGFCLKRV